jgi:hypothetical protein
MLKRAVIATFVLGMAVSGFAGSYETHSKLNALEWDETSHKVYAWLDNTTTGEYDYLYNYDWTASGNSVEKAKAIYSTLLSSYTAGLPIRLFYYTQAFPATTGTGTQGTIGAVGLGVPGTN